MTLEEMNEELRETQETQGTRPKKTLLALPPCREVEIVEEMTCDLPGHVFLDKDEDGHMTFMTISEDGRKVPLEKW